MYCTEDCKCSLCRELRGFDYRKDCERKRVTPKDLKNNKDRDGNVVGVGNGNFSMMKKAKSSFELAPKPLDIKFKNNTPTKYPSTADLAPPQDNKHKVVIYFSDAYNNICKPIHSQMSSSNNDIDHAKRLVSEMETKQLPTIVKSNENNSTNENKDFLKQLKTVLQEKSKFTNKFNNLRPAPQPPIKQQITPKPPLAAKPNVVKIQQTATLSEQINHETEFNSKTKLLPSYIESIENNVINLKIEQNFKKASELVNLISSLSKKVKRKSDTSAETSSVHELNFSQEDDEENDVDEDEESDDDTASEPAEGYYYDWSFVQEWRSRPLKRTANVATNKLTKTAAVLKATAITSNGQSHNKHQMLSHNNSDHLIPIESHHQKQHQLDKRGVVASSGLNKMQSQQPITSIGIPKIAKEVVLRSSNGHGSGVVDNNVISSQQHHQQQQQQQQHIQQQQQQQHHQQQRHNVNDIKSPINHFGSPPRIQCVSSSMIPERDFGPGRLPASPPTITQSTPLSATIVQPNYKPIPQRATRLTVQSTPVKTLPALVSSGLNKTYLQHNNHPSPMHHNISNTSNNNNHHNVSKIIVSNDMDDKQKHHHAIPSSSSSSSLSNAQIPAHINKPLPPPIHGPMMHPMTHQYHPQSPPQNIGISGNPQGLQPQALKPKSTINVTRTHHHGGGGSLDFQGFHKINECQSSSDENRSSGHASMSDTGHGSSSPGSNKTGNGQLVSVPEDRLAAGVTNRNGRSRASTGHTKPRHRATPAKIPWSGNGLEDIKLAIQQLTLRSQTSTSTYSSLSAGSESSEPARRLGRYSSMETVNTNVTSADEFVWVDSHNRLVELQHPPWSQYCLMRVIRTGRCRDIADRVSAEAVPRLGYLLTRALVRISREIQRLSSVLSLCSKHEVSGAFKMVLAPALSDSCIKACLRSAAMFAISGDGALKQTKSARAGLQLPVGRFHRWMVDARLGKLVHEYAAVYLCAGFENLLEEILLQSMPSECTVSLTAMGLEHAIANSGDLWGLLQPFVHLNAGRIASGALTMPRWTSQTSVVSNQSAHSKQQEPCLLTTCVGSLAELKDLVNRSQKRSNHITMSQAALRELFYFMRCSQLEHNNEATTATNATTNATTSSTNIQELCYERAYIVLPPLIEWLRVASAHSDYRHSTLIDRNDIIQAARLLLPGVDCPPRQICCNEELPSAKVYTIPSNVPYHNQGSISSSSSNSNSTDEYIESGRRATIDLGFRLMLSGIPELLIQAMSLVPPTTRYDTLNHQGLTALMLAALRNDETAIQTLLDSGANPNIEVPAIGCPNCPAIHPETQHWTAVTFASCRGNYTALRVLLERGGKVEGGARLSEEKCTLTPLQVASGSGCIDIVSLLLAHGASSFLSTKQNSMSFSGAQRGCYSAISVATAHGQRLSLRKLLSHPFVPEKRDVLSLEEMLAEGDNNTRSVHDRQNEAPPTLSKQQIRTLQEAMYHSAENNYLDITIELRALGVPWTLHCWMHALAAAHELRLDTVIDQLLQDFLQVCPDDYSQQFVMECLPLLFNIFRYSKKEGTTLLLADIFSTCFAWEPIKPIKETVLQPVNGSRIDPKFVNNPELSDVTFRVEGKIFYGHKIVLVTASPRLQSLLSSKVNEGNGTPTVQINDIRYHIFELVMQYLYCGGCNNMDVVPGDVLELMAAASFFQLEGLLRYTEARCAEIIDIDNVVAMYIHAKVYNASKLMEYCQGFLLQNMVALLTYDDSVKRLLFAKKIPNHDVLSGLLTTLQQRIKTRRSISQNMPQQPQQQQQQQQHQQQQNIINNNNNNSSSSNNIVKPVPIIANSNHNNSTNALLNKSNNNLNNNSQIE